MLAFAAICLLISSSEAQDDTKKKRRDAATRKREGRPARPPRSLTASFVGLLSNPRVQEELKFSEEQQAKLKNAPNVSREESAKARELPEEQRRAKYAEIQKIQQQRAKVLEELLNDEQKSRLKEIILQVSGPEVVMHPEIAKELGISDEQRSSSAKYSPAPNAGVRHERSLKNFPTRNDGRSLRNSRKHAER